MSISVMLRDVNWGYNTNRNNENARIPNSGQTHKGKYLEIIPSLPITFRMLLGRWIGSFAFVTPSNIAHDIDWYPNAWRTRQSENLCAPTRLWSHFDNVRLRMTNLAEGYHNSLGWTPGLGCHMCDIKFWREIEVNIKSARYVQLIITIIEENKIMKQLVCHLHRGVRRHQRISQIDHSLWW